MNNTEDRSSQIVDDIKWFMFNDGESDVCNDFGFQHGLLFSRWNKDGKSFIATDCNGDEYRITVTKE